MAAAAAGAGAGAGATTAAQRLRVYQTAFEHKGSTYRVGDHVYMGDDKFLARVDTLYEDGTGAGYVEGVWLYRARDIAPFVSALGRQPLTGEVFLSRDKCANHRSFVVGRCTVVKRADVPGGDLAAWSAQPDHYFFELLFDSEAKTFHTPESFPQPKETAPPPEAPKPEVVPPKVRVKVAGVVSRACAAAGGPAAEMIGEGSSATLKVAGQDYAVGDHALFRTEHAGVSPPIGRITSIGHDAPTGGSVVVCVEWLARPAETPFGAEAAHNELFATTETDVVPASSISGPCVVVHGDAPPPAGGFFWRRTYDTARNAMVAPRAPPSAAPAAPAEKEKSHKRKSRPASGSAATPPPSQKPRVAKPSPEMAALARGKRPAYEFSVGPKRALLTYELGEGWYNEIAPRSAPSNRVDTYWYSPDGCKFRSTTEVLRHIQSKGWPLKLVSAAGKPPAPEHASSPSAVAAAAASVSAPAPASASAPAAVSPAPAPAPEAASAPAPAAPAAAAAEPASQQPMTKLKLVVAAQQNSSAAAQQGEPNAAPAADHTVVASDPQAQEQQQKPSQEPAAQNQAAPMDVAPAAAAPAVAPAAPAASAEATAAARGPEAMEVVQDTPPVPAPDKNKATRPHAQPASSSISPGLCSSLLASADSDRLSTSSPLALMAAPAMPPDLSVQFRLLLKPSPVTRLRASAEILSLLASSAPADPEACEALAAVWAAMYPRLSSDPERSVRERANGILCALVRGAATKRSVGRRVRELLPSWLASSHDPCREVAARALEALSLVPAANLDRARAECARDIAGFVGSGLAAALSAVQRAPRDAPDEPSERSASALVALACDEAVRGSAAAAQALFGTPGGPRDTLRCRSALVRRSALSAALQAWDALPDAVRDAVGPIALAECLSKEDDAACAALAVSLAAAALARGVPAPQGLGRSLAHAVARGGAPAAMSVPAVLRALPSGSAEAQAVAKSLAPALSDACAALRAGTTESDAAALARALRDCAAAAGDAAFAGDLLCSAVDRAVTDDKCSPAVADALAGCLVQPELAARIESSLSAAAGAGGSAAVRAASFACKAADAGWLPAGPACVAAAARASGDAELLQSLMRARNDPSLALVCADGRDENESAVEWFVREASSGDSSRSSAALEVALNAVRASSLDARPAMWAELVGRARECGPRWLARLLRAAKNDEFSSTTSAVITEAATAFLKTPGQQPLTEAVELAIAAAGVSSDGAQLATVSPVDAGGVVALASCALGRAWPLVLLSAQEAREQDSRSESDAGDSDEGEAAEASDHGATSTAARMCSAIGARVRRELSGGSGGADLIRIAARLASTSLCADLSAPADPAWSSTFADDAARAVLCKKLASYIARFVQSAHETPSPKVLAGALESACSAWGLDKSLLAGAVADASRALSGLPSSASSLAPLLPWGRAAITSPTPDCASPSQGAARTALRLCRALCAAVSLSTECTSSRPWAALDMCMCSLLPKQAGDGPLHSSLDSCIPRAAKSADAAALWRHASACAHESGCAYALACETLASIVECPADVVREVVSQAELTAQFDDRALCSLQAVCAGNADAARADSRLRATVSSELSSGGKLVAPRRTLECALSLGLAAEAVAALPQVCSGDQMPTDLVLSVLRVCATAGVVPAATVYHVALSPYPDAQASPVCMLAAREVALRSCNAEVLAMVPSLVASAPSERTRLGGLAQLWPAYTSALLKACTGAASAPDPDQSLLMSVLSCESDLLRVLSCAGKAERSAAHSLLCAVLPRRVPPAAPEEGSGVDEVLTPGLRSAVTRKAPRSRDGPEAAAHMLAWSVLHSVLRPAPPDVRARVSALVRASCSMSSHMSLVLSAMQGGDALARDLFVDALDHLPALCRAWASADLDRRSLAVAMREARDSASHIAERELDAASSYAGADDVFAIRCSRGARTVTAAYTKDDLVLEVALELPESYPLDPARPSESTRRVGVTEATWRKWQLAMVSMLAGSHDGASSVVDALVLWRGAVDRHFEGVEPCPICYSVFAPGGAGSSASAALPTMACRQCKNKFHSACMYRWFETSHNTFCPLCKADMSASRS
eukprot:m51a1_g1189 hypothetical protein (2081) ;mRNA; r:413127-420249